LLCVKRCRTPRFEIVFHVQQIINQLTRDGNVIHKAKHRRIHTVNAGVVANAEDANFQPTVLSGVALRSCFQ
jgi:hypothetical protein